MPTTALSDDTGPPPPIPAAVVGTTFGGIVTLWSWGAEQIFGWSRDEALGRPVAELAEWGLSGHDFAEFVFFGASGVWIREHVVKARDGRRLMLRTTASLVVGPDGQDELIASIAPIEAVTAGGQPVLRDRPFRAVAERGGDLVVICDQNMVINYVGPSLREMFGYQSRQVIGTGGWRYLHPAEYPALKREWHLAVSNPGSHREVELRLRDASGGWRHVQVRISNLVADLAISAIVLNIRDVTEQRRLAEELTDSRRLLQSILDAAIEGVWVTDPTGRTVFANSRMAELLAVDQSKLASGSVGDFFDPVAMELVRQRMKNRATGVREQYELPFLRLDGQNRWFHVSAVPRYDLEGRYLGAIEMCTDITERKQLERKLDRMSPDRGGDGAAERGRPANDSYISGQVSEYLRSAGAESLDGTRSMDTGGGAVPGLDRLSRREIEVVRMLLLGDRVPVIAQHLFVSQSTVRNHLSSVFRKLRVGSQQELIVLLRERDLKGWAPRH